MYYVLTRVDNFIIVEGVDLLFLDDGMKLLLSPLLNIISYALVLYGMERFGLLFGIVFHHGAVGTWDLIKVYILIGVVFWLGFSILNFIITILTYPLRMFTLGVVSWLVNIIVMYVCQFIINVYLVGIHMEIVSVAGVLVTSLLLGVLISIVYWLIGLLFK